MHRGGELRQSRDLAVVVRAQLPRRRLPVPADVDVAGDDQRRSAAGDRPVEVDEFRRDEAVVAGPRLRGGRSEEHTSELQSLMRISYAVFCLKKKKQSQNNDADNSNT